MHQAHTEPAGLQAPSVLAGLQRLIGGDSVSVNLIDHRFPSLVRATAHQAEEETWAVPCFSAGFTWHPAYAPYRSRALAQGSLVSLSDLAEGSALRRQPRFAELYRPNRIADQLLAFVRVGAERGTVLVFNRSRSGISHRDRQVLQVLLPHLTQIVVQQRERRELIARVHESARLERRLAAGAERMTALTPREQEVGRLLARGAGDRQIARALGVSERTVHKHLENTYRKLGLTNRTALTALLNRREEPADSPRR